MRETSDIFFSITGSWLYPSSHLFRMWLLSMLWCGLTITHFSTSSPSANLYFIPLFHHTSSDFILFSFCLMFDMGSVSTHYTCLFDVTIHLSSLFVWGPLGPGLMIVFYALHLMHEGYGDYIIGIFEPSFLSFLSLYYLSLRYVPCLKTTLRPLCYIVFDSSHVDNTWA